MRRFMVTGMAALACVSVLGSAATARAIAIRISPVHERVGQADCIVVGKVTSIEEKPVMARQFPGANEKAAFQVASVNIKEALHGVKGLTDIRVAFIGQGRLEGGIKDKIREGNVRIRPIRRPFIQPNLVKDQEALLFLTKHFEEDFYTISGFQGITLKKDNPNFAKELGQVKKLTKLLDKPMNGLKAKEANDRLMTASLLLARYRTQRPSATQPKTKPVDAEISKRILAILAEADWSRYDPELQINATQLFNQLGLTQKDGWTPPRVVKDYGREMSEAFKAWLKKNGDKYRIQQFVVEKQEKKEDKE